MAFSKELEELIEAALADGVITEKERAVLHKKAMKEGVDPDELDMVVDGRLAKLKKQESVLPPSPPKAAKEKHGNIVTCPNCGEPVPGGAAVCPACGYEFRNISANKTAKDFANGLNKLKKEAYQGANIFKQGGNIDAEQAYIKNFPVPNTAEDILEILKLIKPQAKNDDIIGYWDLYTRCIESAKLNFPNDKRFSSYINDYDKEKKNKRGVKTTLVWICAIAGCICLLFFMGKYQDHNIEQELASINEYKEQRISTISELEVPTVDNYNAMRSALISLTYDVSYIGEQKGYEKRQKAEMAAYQSFMEAKKSYAKQLNAIYMDMHDGQSDSSLQDILNFSSKDVTDKFMLNQSNPE